MTVHVEYVHPVQIDGDHYLFRFPMVVGPRYIPGQPLVRPAVGRGWSSDTDQVPDASRITPQPMPAGMRNGNDVRILVRVDAGMPIQGITDVSHELEIAYDTASADHGDDGNRGKQAKVDDSPASGKQRATSDEANHDPPKDNSQSRTKAIIRLKNQSTMADKDFVLEYRLAGQDTTLASLAHRGDQGGYFALVLQPQWKIAAAELAPREVVLLLDCSGSMQGFGISQLRLFGEKALESLNPQDTFRVVAFNTRVWSMSGQAVPATGENIAQARQFIWSLEAGGGTEMLQGLKAGLGTSRSETARPRYLVLVTDALVGNDDGILGYLKGSEFADVRAFPVAVGPAPNHYLISRLAEVRRGFAMRVTNQDNAAEIARLFNEKIQMPYMTDLEIDWGSLKVQDVLPQPLPDLYADRPLVVMGRYDTPGKSELKLKGNVQGQRTETALSLTLPEKEPAHDCLGPLWARQRIRCVENRDLGHETAEGREEITRLGLDHQLMTRYTSFVAVEADATELLRGDLRTQAIQPMLPEGMTNEGVGLSQMAAARANQPPVTPAAPPMLPRQDFGGSASAARYQPSSSPSGGSHYSGGGGGGGSVEWLFLGSLAALGGGRLLNWCRQRRRHV